MLKRRKWDFNEDQILSALILGLGRSVLTSDDWEVVSARMAGRGLSKTPKQCRER